MLSYRSHTYFMLIAFIIRTINGEDCDAGWFGENCMYKCHCSQSTSCDQSTGECPNNGSCSIEYFGPACQFEDRTYSDTASSVPSFLRDSNDDTCNPDLSATSVVMVQKNGYPFSFVRIVVNDDRNLQNFTMTLDGKPCSNKRVFRASDRIIDVTCDVSWHLKKLRIDGAIASNICSIYISGGRNVALRQNTSQTSTHDIGVSSKAVDGNTNRDYDAGGCTQTNNQTSPEWNVTFNRPQIMYRWILHNRDSFQDRLRYFKIGATDINGNTDGFESTSSSDTSIYSFNLLSDMHTTDLRITLQGTNRILTLCEVEVWGDPICPKETYGVYCQHPCQCNKTERCHITGACAPGCSPGFYQTNCTSRCSINCLEGICEWITGNCFQCTPGYRGDKCNTECAPDSYGENCERKCSLHCADTCNHTNGECACMKGFTGPGCAECPPGSYGENCESNCSLHCADTCKNINGECTCMKGFTGPGCAECAAGYYGENCESNCSLHCADTCNHTNGECTCMKGYTGPGCAVCADTFYGEQCEKRCSLGCLNRLCERTTGKCFSCVAGYQGDYCSNESSYYLLVIIPLGLLVFLLCLLAQRETSVAAEM